MRFIRAPGIATRRSPRCEVAKQHARQAALEPTHAVKDRQRERCRQRAAPAHKSGRVVLRRHVVVVVTPARKSP